MSKNQSSNEGGALPVLVRFTDLKAAGITDNWPHLARLIDQCGFPSGILLSRNVRAWDAASVRQWLAARPVERKIVNPPRKQREHEAA
jgi:predicted DNA-binding transcriptional regulator AlpA